MTRLLVLGLAAMSLSSVPAAVAQGAPDLSQLAVGADAIGDGWIGGGQVQTPKDAAALFEAPSPSTSYSADYTNGPAHPGVYHLDIALAAYVDRQTALNSSGFADKEFYWGHGNTTFSDLTGQYGDGPAYQALGFTDGITFIDGTIVAYVGLLANDMSLDDRNALVSQVASAEDGLLQSAAGGSGTAQNIPASSAPDLSALKGFPGAVLVLPLDQPPYMSWPFQGAQLIAGKDGPYYAEGVASPDQGIGADGMTIQGSVGGWPGGDPHDQFKPACQSPYCYYPPFGQTSGSEIFNGLQARGDAAFVLHNTFPSDIWSVWWFDQASKTNYKLSFGGDNVLMALQLPGGFAQSNMTAAQKLAANADKLVVWTGS